MDEQDQTSQVVAVFGSQAAKDILPYDQPAYTRTIHTREVTFTCEECGKTVTQQHFPGPLPRYCSADCRLAVRRRTVRESVRRHRGRKKLTSDITDQKI